MTKGINNKDWKLVSFGEMCKNLNESEREPLANGIDRYVGLEHIETNNLHINSWGNIADGTTFTKRFRKGQVLFGKRRAYLRKAAISDFDGICSGDILVFEANEKVIIPELLPFIVNSDRFFDYAIQTSAGSLSPRTKFQDLAKLKFRLPPKEQQPKLAELLWASDEVIEKYNVQLENIKNLLQASVEISIWNSKEKKSKIKNITIKEVKGFVDGDWIESKDQSESGIRLIQLADIGIGVFIDKSRRYISENTFKRLKCFELRAGDLLIARMPDPLGRSCIFPKINEKSITAVDVCVVRIDTEQHNPKYWEYAFNSKSWFELMNIYASGTTRTRISKKNLEELELPYPTKAKQNSIVKHLELITDVKNKVDQTVGIQKQIQKKLINQIFN